MMYVAYEDGVYRHRTIAFGCNLEDLTPAILEYFNNTDDYHTVTVELLDTHNTEPVVICYYNQKVSYRYYTRTQGYGAGRMRAIDGECVIYKDGEVFHKYSQSYKLKDGEVWDDN
jgi:hypothetical protein